MKQSYYNNLEEEVLALPESIASERYNKWRARQCLDELAMILKAEKEITFNADDLVDVTKIRKIKLRCYLKNKHTNKTYKFDFEMRTTAVGGLFIRSLLDGWHADGYFMEVEQDCNQEG